MAAKKVLKNSSFLFFVLAGWGIRDERKSGSRSRIRNIASDLELSYATPLTGPLQLSWSRTLFRKKT
jgi:hypothetical protein